MKEASKYMGESTSYVIVETELAFAFGERKAIIIKKIDGWLKYYKREDSRLPKAKRKHYRNGRWWVYNSLPDWHLELPFISATSLENNLKQLRDEGILMTDNFNKKSFDRTLWYTVDYDELDRRIDGAMPDLIKLTFPPDMGPGVAEEPESPDVPSPKNGEMVTPEQLVGHPVSGVTIPMNNTMKNTMKNSLGISDEIPVEASPLEPSSKDNTPLPQPRASKEVVTEKPDPEAKVPYDELSSLGKYLLGLCRGTAKSLTAAQSAQLAKEHLVIGPNDEPIYVIPDQLYEENQVLVERWTTTRPYPVLWEQKGKYGIARGKMVDVFTASGTGEHNLGSFLFYIRTNERSIKGAEMAKDEDYAYGINPFRVPLPDVHYTPEELKEMGFGGDDDD